MAPGPGLDRDVKSTLNCLLRPRSYTGHRPGTLTRLKYGTHRDCENGKLLLGVWMRRDNAFRRGRVWKNDR